MDFFNDFLIIETCFPTDDICVQDWSVLYWYIGTIIILLILILTKRRYG